MKQTKTLLTVGQQLPTMSVNFREEYLIMKFQKLVLELTKYESLDIIAASPEDPTQPTTDPQLGTDPYEADKW